MREHLLRDVTGNVHNGLVMPRIFKAVVAFGKLTAPPLLCGLGNSLRDGF
ncbi:MAG: hypothetical protein ABR907_16210 [Terracidiphilus sp.]